MIELNCMGMRCPLPIINLARQIQALSIGDQVRLHSDDPATEMDLSAWSRMTGHVVAKNSETIFTITKR